MTKMEYYQFIPSSQIKYPDFLRPAFIGAIHHPLPITQLLLYCLPPTPPPLYYYIFDVELNQFHKVLKGS